MEEHLSGMWYEGDDVTWVDVPHNDDDVFFEHDVIDRIVNRSWTECLIQYKEQGHQCKIAVWV